MFHVCYEISFQKGVEHALKVIKERGASERWRGWNYTEDNMTPPYYEPMLPMYIVANKYCPTGRDTFLERVRGEAARRTRSMVEGHLYHVIYRELIRTARNYISAKRRNIEAMGVETYLKKRRNSIVETHVDSDGRLQDALSEGIINSHGLRKIKSNIIKLWDYESELLRTHVSFLICRDPQINVETLVSRAVPILTEQQVDGTRLSLSERLTLDAITTIPNKRIVIDLKTGKAEEFHKLTTTGYALAWESLEKEPIDIGCIMYLRFSSGRSTPEIKCNFHPITDELRSWFIEARNEKIQMIATQQDPGFPDSCPLNCPYSYLCTSERGE